MVYDNFGKWDEDKYALVEPALWQTDDGRFISLDHQIALGANGISLNDYYGGVTSTDPTENTTKGDVNGDSSVNVVDAMLFRRYLLDGTTAIVAENADWDQDDAVALTDLISLNHFLLRR